MSNQIRQSGVICSDQVERVDESAVVYDFMNDFVIVDILTFDLRRSRKS